MGVDIDSARKQIRAVGVNLSCGRTKPATDLCDDLSFDTDISLGNFTSSDDRSIADDEIHDVSSFAEAIIRRAKLRGQGEHHQGVLHDTLTEITRLRKGNDRWVGS